MWNLVQMKGSAGKTIVVIVKYIFFSWTTLPRSLAVEYLHRAAAIAISEAPSPSHIYFHGNPETAFCSLKTTFALSSCKPALSRAECIPTALNEYKKKKKEKAWIWLGNFYLGGPAAGRNEQPSSDLVSVNCLVRKKQSRFMNWLRGGREWCVCGASAAGSCGRGADGRAGWAGGLPVSCMLWAVQTALSCAVCRALPGIGEKMVSY